MRIRENFGDSNMALTAIKFVSVNGACNNNAEWMDLECILVELTGMSMGVETLKQGVMRVMAWHGMN